MGTLHSKADGLQPYGVFLEGLIIHAVVLLLLLLSILLRPIQRFWFLEMVARMPYFSYITMLHLYETFGWWRAGGLPCARHLPKFKVEPCRGWFACR